MSTNKQGMFVLADGRNVLFTFCLVSSLFLLWGFCNGMIDVMDKHFQEELHLSLSQSAWVQFAHWMGYFLMSLPAGWLATRLGYKGGIIAGLLLVAVGGFWFIPATKIASFWAFLLGVCVVASGLTFLETVANPYTTVLGPPRYAATRINAAQSCNGVGWILGPIAGTLFFYGKDTSGHSTGSQTLWIPYAGVAVAVLILAVMFFFAPVPDVKAEDDYNIEGNDDNALEAGAPAVRKVNRGLSYCLLLGNIVALFSVFNMIAWLVLNSLGVGAHLVGFASALPHPAKMAVTGETALFMTFIVADGVALVLAALWLIGFTKRLTHHSIWSHEHFSGATLAQFLYVAAQCRHLQLLHQLHHLRAPYSALFLAHRRHQQMDRGQDRPCRLGLQRRLRPGRQAARQGGSSVGLPRLQPLREPPCKPWPITSKASPATPPPASR